jgi:acid phosphatase family membrane protein YuiD
MVQATFGKNEDPISKITRRKRAGGICQTIEHLPCKHKALSSNSSATIGKEKIWLTENFAFSAYVYWITVF